MKMLWNAIKRCDSKLAFFGQLQVFTPTGKMANP